MFSWASPSLLVLGVIALIAVLNGLRPTHVFVLAPISWLASVLAMELAGPLIALGVLASAVLVALGALASPAGWIGLTALLLGDLLSLAGILRSHRTEIEAPDLGDGPTPRHPNSPYPLTQAVFPWLVLRRRGVRTIRGVPYAQVGGTTLLLDAYLPQRPGPGLRPAVVQIHGGAFMTGSRHEGMPLLTHLAANGWAAFSIDYRLSPRATFPDHLVDVKRAIAWVREHAAEHDVDPSFVALTGGSAGAILCTLAALTENDAILQPGFEEADTSVSAFVASYGAFDLTDGSLTQVKGLMWSIERWVFKARIAERRDLFRAASAVHRVRPDSPPALLVHGTLDTVIPVEQSRRFFALLRAVSRNPVQFIEVPGGQHGFDVIPSIRTIRVVSAVERFLAATLAAHRQSDRKDHV